MLKALKAWHTPTQVGAMRLVIDGVFGLSVVMLSTGAAASAESLTLQSLPIPVQAYVFREAVEAGVADPWSIQSNGETDFLVPGSQNSDLNGDAEQDYAVALCMFNEKTPQFWTNGYPCSFGALIISNSSGGYDFVPTSGLVVGSKVGAKPSVTIRERQFNQECDDYVCDFEYQLQANKDSYGYTLVPSRVCLPDKCN